MFSPAGALTRHSHPFSTPSPLSCQGQTSPLRFLEIRMSVTSMRLCCNPDHPNYPLKRISPPRQTHLHTEQPEPTLEEEWVHPGLGDDSFSAAEVHFCTWNQRELRALPSGC